MRFLVISGVCLLLYGCTSATDHFETVPPGSSGKAVNPDQFRVDSDDYPDFRVPARTVPPDAETYWIAGAERLSMTPILPSDRWKTTHVYRGFLIVQSEEYNERQCRYLDEIDQNPAGGGVNVFGVCLQAFEYGIYLNDNGEIVGGWEVLPGKQKVLGARKIYLAPSDGKASDWPEALRFVLY